MKILKINLIKKSLKLNLRRAYNLSIDLLKTQMIK